MFELRANNDLPHLVITELENEGITALFTTRKGGVSQGSYRSLNLGFHTADRRVNIEENRKKVAALIGFNIGDFVAGEQVHGDNIYRVTEKDRGRGALNHNNTIPGVDSLITNVRGLPLISFYADCVPLYIYDSHSKAIGLAHAGWKGTLLEIGSKTLNRMVREFGTEPENCIAAVGPAISADCYEVGVDVKNNFCRRFEFHRRILRQKERGKYYLNLPLVNKLQLVEAGVKPDNVIVSRRCTMTEGEWFYSYRRDGGKTGRMASIIVL